MALKAGYQGVKKSMIDALKSLSGMKVIKSFGDGLNLTSAGKLNLTAAASNKLGGIKVGTGLSIDDGVLSADATGIEVKTLSYTGDGTSTSTIDFSNEDELPSVILGICGESANSYYACSTPILYGVQQRAYCYWSQPTGNKNGAVNIVTYTGTDNEVMHITAANSGEALNDLNKTYTVYYI